MSERTRIIVIGGGYAGVMAANRVLKRDDVDVTLINERPTFVERIRLHQLVGGSNDAVVSYGDVLAARIRLVVDTVSRIDAAARRVILESGDELTYDYLIYTVGSHSAAATVPGAAEFAHPLSTLEEAERVRARLDGTPSGAPVVVVGAGPSGIETAAELAETGRAVTLVCGGILGPYLHKSGRRSVARHLAALRVTVLQGPDAVVTSVMRDAVELRDGRHLASALTIWTAGFAASDLAARSGLATDPSGRLLTDETLTSIDDDRIVAGGDAASPSGLPFRMSCQAAGPLGAHAADTVLNRIAGTNPHPIELGFAGQCISLGRRAGVFQFAHKNDTALLLYIGGAAGAKVKELVCWGTVKQLVDEAKRPGALRWGWSKDSSRARLLEAKRDETVAAVGRAA